MLIFLAQFHSGLLFEDFEILSSLGKIPLNWYELLETLTIQTLSISKEKRKLLTKSAPLAIKKNFSDESNKSSKVKEFSSIPPNEYFWLKVIKEENRQTVILVKNHIIAYLKEKKELRNSEIEIKGVEYLMHLSNFCVKKIKFSKGNCEKLVEHCRICSEGFWENQEFDTLVPDDLVTEMMEAAKIELDQSFQVHRNSFYNILYSEDVSSLLSSASTL